MIKAIMGLLLSVSSASSAFAGDIWIFGEEGDGLKKLGCLSCNEYNSDSVFNKYGTYGSPYSSSSIWNKYGWGSKYKSESPCNQYSSNSPILMDIDSMNKIGRLSINKNSSDSICNSVSGVPKVCDMVKVICSDD